MRAGRPRLGRRAVDDIDLGFAKMIQQRLVLVAAAMHQHDAEIGNGLRCEASQLTAEIERKLSQVTNHRHSSAGKQRLPREFDQ